MKAELLPDEPSDLETEPLEPEPLEPDDASDLDYVDMPCTDDDGDDDSRWEVFVADDDERDPEQDSGDFRIENARKVQESRRLGDKEDDDVDHRLRVSSAPCPLV
ncbi:MAG: hypothetical protein WD971_04340 [Pirellulales bacterium]